MFGKNKEEFQTDLEIFVIYDSKSKSYSDPIPETNKDVLLREFLTVFKDPERQQKSRYYTNAEDYSIFRAASYDRKQGVFMTQNLEHIMNMHDLRALVTPDKNVRALSPT